MAEKGHFVPGSNRGIQLLRGMQQERGGGRFGFAERTKGGRGAVQEPAHRLIQYTSSVRTKDDPTREEARDANSLEFTRDTQIAKTGAKIGRPLAIVGGSVAVIGGTAVVLDKTVPAVHETIGRHFPWNTKASAQEDINNAVQRLNASERFDNTATKGVVGPKNILYVPREEFDKTPIADAQGNPLFNFPWDINHSVEIRYHKNALKDHDIAWLKSGGLINADDYRGYEPGIYSENPLPAGFEFSAIYPGRLFFMGSVYDEEASRKSPSNPYGLAVHKEPIIMAKIEFIAPNGILYFVNIEIIDDSGGREKQLPILPLIDAPLINPDNRNGQDWEKGTRVEELQKIFSTTQKGKLKMIIQGGLNGRLDGPNAERVPGTFKFKTVTDATGIKKIPLPEPK